MLTIISSSLIKISMLLLIVKKLIVSINSSLILSMIYYDRIDLSEKINHAKNIERRECSLLKSRP